MLLDKHYCPVLLCLFCFHECIFVFGWHVTCCKYFCLQKAIFTFSRSIKLRKSYFGIKVNTSMIFLFCFCFFSRCVVFNNRGVSGEVLLVGLILLTQAVFGGRARFSEPSGGGGGGRD